MSSLCQLGARSTCSSTKVGKLFTFESQAIAFVSQEIQRMRAESSFISPGILMTMHLFAHLTVQVISRTNELLCYYMLRIKLILIFPS